MDKKISLKNIYMYFLLFFIFFIDSSFIMIDKTSGSIRIGLNLMFSILLIIANKKISIKKATFLNFSLILIAITLSGLIFDTIKQTIIIATSVIVGFIVANTLDKENFKKYYINIMYFLAVFSLITFIIESTIPSITHMLPIVKSSDGVNYYNAIFSIVSDNSYLIRNYGIFWEPGAYSIFLTIALFFELNNKSPRKKILLIYTICIITTFSTLGIICMIILYIYFLFQNNKFNINKRKLKKFVLFGIIFATILLLTTNTSFIFHVFGKLFIKSNDGYNFSTTSRVDAIIYPIKAFLINPIFGIGYNNFGILKESYCNGLTTCTYVNWLCIYGILGLFPSKWCANFFTSHSNTKMTKLIILLFSILLFSTEDFIQISFIYILIFYGMVKKHA